MRQEVTRLCVTAPSGPAGLGEAAGLVGWSEEAKSCTTLGEEAEITGSVMEEGPGEWPKWGTTFKS